jgi:Ni/Co efflux regulator RcnB
MNAKKLVLALAAIAAAAAGMPSWAQERGYHNDTSGRYDVRDERHEGRYDRDNRYQRGDRVQADRRNEEWSDGRRSEGGWGRSSDFHSGYDGYGPDHNMRRGDRLPNRYRSHQYVVDNWRAHHLSAPPRGHHWVQVGADYVLVAAATGLIVNAVIGH